MSFGLKIKVVYSDYLINFEKPIFDEKARDPLRSDIGLDDFNGANKPAKSYY